MNETATNIFLQNDQSIILRRARLYAQNPIEDKKLQGLIYKACQTGRKLGDSGGGALVISKKHSRGVIHVLVGPALKGQTPTDLWQLSLPRIRAPKSAQATRFYVGCTDLHRLNVG